jgi:anti-sigma regulatory factor (Ser/Thr protein kinase)
VTGVDSAPHHPRPGDDPPASRLAIESDVEQLAELRAFVREAVTRLGGTKRNMEDLVQAVDEAACNVIVHGYHGQPGPIEVEVARRDDAIAIRLLDRATTFDPTAGPAPDPANPTITPRKGGMGVGVHLLRTMTDEVHHSARPDGGNELTLVRSIGGPAEED